MTKKISQGHYLHIATGIHIAFASHHGYWNLWNDAWLCDEYAIGFMTKKEAIDYLNTKAK